MKSTLIFPSGIVLSAAIRSIGIGQIQLLAATLHPGVDGG